MSDESPLDTVLALAAWILLLIARCYSDRLSDR